MGFLNHFRIKIHFQNIHILAYNRNDHMLGAPYLFLGIIVFKYNMAVRTRLIFFKPREKSFMHQHIYGI